MASGTCLSVKFPAAVAWRHGSATASSAMQRLPQLMEHTSLQKYACMHHPVTPYHTTLLRLGQLALRVLLCQTVTPTVAKPSVSQANLRIYKAKAKPILKSTKLKMRMRCLRHALPHQGCPWCLCAQRRVHGCPTWRWAGLRAAACWDRDTRPRDTPYPNQLHRWIHASVGNLATHLSWAEG